MRIGIALPITIQMAFPMLDAAGLTTAADGTGDIALTLRPGQRIAYLLLWPHARPWKLMRAEPTLRGIADAAGRGADPEPGANRFGLATGQGGFHSSQLRSPAATPACRRRRNGEDP